MGGGGGMGGGREVETRRLGRAALESGLGRGSYVVGAQWDEGNMVHAMKRLRLSCANGHVRCAVIVQSVRTENTEDTPHVTNTIYSNCEINRSRRFRRLHQLRNPHPAGKAPD